MVLLSLNNTLCWFVLNILSFKGGLGTLWSSVLRQPLNFASAHFWTRRGCEAGKRLSLKKWVCQMKTEGGEWGKRKWRFNFQREKATEVEMGVKKRREKKKEPRMDAPLIALNHSVPLFLHRCVDTTSANTQGRCWLPLVINGREMTYLRAGPAGLCIILSEYCNKAWRIITNGSLCWHTKWMSTAVLWVFFFPSGAAFISYGNGFWADRIGWGGAVIRWGRSVFH